MFFRISLQLELKRRQAKAGHFPADDLPLRATPFFVGERKSALGEKSKKLGERIAPLAKKNKPTRRKTKTEKTERKTEQPHARTFPGVFCFLFPLFPQIKNTNLIISDLHTIISTKLLFPLLRHLFHRIGEEAELEERKRA